MKFHDLCIDANSFIASRSIDSLLLKKILKLKKITVYTKRSPSHEDHWDIILLRNSLN